MKTAIPVGEPAGSLPAKLRPVAVAAHPGNVFLPASATGLPRDFAVNVTQLVTLNRTEVKGREPAGEIPSDLMADVDVGLRLALEL